MRRKKMDVKVKKVNAAIKYYLRSITYFYEWDGNRCIWWQNNHPGDVFDIITKDELDKRLEAAANLKLRVVDHLPGYCSEGDNCPDHLGYH